MHILWPTIFCWNFYTWLLFALRTLCFLKSKTRHDLADLLDHWRLKRALLSFQLWGADFTVTLWDVKNILVKLLIWTHSQSSYFVWKCWCKNGKIIAKLCQFMIQFLCVNMRSSSCLGYPTWQDKNHPLFLVCACVCLRYLNSVIKEMCAGISLRTHLSWS